jgi:hypothetical protein
VDDGRGFFFFFIERWSVYHTQTGGIEGNLCLVSPSLLDTPGVVSVRECDVHTSVVSFFALACVNGGCDAWGNISFNFVVFEGRGSSAAEGK